MQRASAAQRTMATDENNHKNEARDDWTGCTFRVERGPSSEGRAWGMADILTDVSFPRSRLAFRARQNLERTTTRLAGPRKKVCTRTTRP